MHRLQEVVLEHSSSLLTVVEHVAELDWWVWPHTAHELFIRVPAFRELVCISLPLNVQSDQSVAVCEGAQLCAAGADGGEPHSHQRREVRDSNVTEVAHTPWSFFSL